MAIEAISQIHHETENAPVIAGYSLRNVAIKSTLRVPDDEIGVETILSLRWMKLTASKSSLKWFEFDISSVLPSTDSWTEHCSGSISVETMPNGMTISLDLRSFRGDHTLHGG